MAKLENLKDFDVEMEMAIRDIRKAMAHQRGFSEEQKEQLNIIQRAIGHLAQAVVHLVHNNR